MTAREIFKLIAKTTGLLLFCYGLIIGICGGILLYTLHAVETTASGPLPIFDIGSFLGSSEGGIYWIIAFLITQGLLPAGTGLLFMGTDIVTDFCYPKRYEKWLPLEISDSRRFEISEGTDQWTPPKF